MDADRGKNDKKAIEETVKGYRKCLNKQVTAAEGDRGLPRGRRREEVQRSLHDLLLRVLVLVSPRALRARHEQADRQARNCTTMAALKKLVVSRYNFAFSPCRRGAAPHPPICLFRDDP